MGYSFHAGRRAWAALLVATLLTTTGNVPTTAAQTSTARSASPSPAEVTADATVEDLFKDFLHYAILGEFIRADAFGKALLAHPDVDPVTVMELSAQEPKSLDTLLTIIKTAKNPSFVETAQRVLELIEKGHFARRHDPERIQANIEKLLGNPQQEAMAIKHLIEGGEYSIPLLIKVLLNPHQQALRVRIVNALPQIGKPAVNPLVMALNMQDNNIRQDLIRALGDIGYPQAIPYLQKARSDPKAHPATKEASSAAIGRIEAQVGRGFPGSTEDLFFELAERYYDENEAVRADPRLEKANVWYWDAAAQELKAVVVPRPIFGPVMAMRCCEEAVLVRNDHGDAIGLWLAANIRREHRLGLNVESADPAETGLEDPTRPTVFPRALYFTQAAGPRYGHRVLERAVRENDSAVALGAIQALRITAGESSLIGSEDFKQPLAQCLRFPDLVVRIKAALALGAALPKTAFADSQFVVPVLAQTLSQSGRQQVIVVDSDQQNANRVMAVLRAGDRDVIADTSFFRALDKARSEFQTVSGIFLATDVAEPAVGEALTRLRAEFAFGKTPVVLLVKAQHSVMAEDLAKRDAYVEQVNAAAPDASLEAAMARVSARTGQSPLQPELALRLALQAAETLQRIALDGRTVFDVSLAAPALISALSAADETLQKAAAAVLALVPSPAAQRAIAHVALDEKNTKTLRVTAFGALAESAKNHGNLLEDSQINRLLAIAKEEADLVVRTAATEALGAVNLATSKASEIIRAYYGG
jgi:HEAT repeat protein